jgi:membrane associated rhomboid family serine protease
VGASGAIFGLVGVVGVDLIQNWKRIKCPIVQMVVWVISVIISLAFGLLPGIDNFAHIGGFVQGIIGACVRPPPLSTTLACEECAALTSWVSGSNRFSCRSWVRPTRPASPGGGSP